MWIHTGAAHLMPLITGQPVCMEACVCRGFVAVGACAWPAQTPPPATANRPSTTRHVPLPLPHRVHSAVGMVRVEQHCITSLGLGSHMPASSGASGKGSTSCKHEPVVHSMQEQVTCDSRAKAYVSNGLSTHPLAQSLNLTPASSRRCRRHGG